MKNMSRKLKVSFIIVILLLIGGSAIAGASPQSAGTPPPSGPARPAGAPNAAPLGQAGSGFTYQGRLKNGGSPANGQYDLQFTLYDTPTGGTQVGTPITVTNQTVTDGLFTVTLDFGGAFQGDARWLDIAVRSTGGGSFTPLSPRQALTAAPYALGLVPGAVVNGSTGPGGILFQVNNSDGNSMAGFTGSATDSAIYGVNSHVTSTLGVGVKGQGYHYATGVEGAGVLGTGVYGHTNSGSLAGVLGQNYWSGNGVQGMSYSGAGGYFTSTYGTGVYGTGGVNGVVGYATVGSANGVYGENTGSGNGVQGRSSGGFGGTGVYGYYTGTYGYGVRGDSNAGIGVFGSYNGTGGNGEGVLGSSINGYGVVGTSTNGPGVYASSGANNGVQSFISNTTAAILGQNGYHSGSTSYGVYGLSTNSDGVYGSGGRNGVTGVSANAAASGVFGQDMGGGNGVYGISAGTGTGLYGQTLGSGDGVYGTSGSGIGVQGQGGTSGDGMQGVTSAATHSGVAGISGSTTAGNGVYGTSASCANCYAGYFDGNVHVAGTLSKSAGSFQIDDPIDPANKYLYHSFVESPDMMNIYNGEATLDAKGEAVVTMPDWFQALNMDFRYQLTSVGAPGPNLYVAQKIQANHFKIAGGAPGTEVSWQVTGIRHDPYADAHRIPVEQPKAPADQGYYLHPDLYGQPNSKNLDPYVRNPPSVPAQPVQPIPASPGGK